MLYLRKHSKVDRILLDDDRLADPAQTKGLKVGLLPGGCPVLADYLCYLKLCHNCFLLAYPLNTLLIDTPRRPAIV